MSALSFESSPREVQRAVILFNCQPARYAHTSWYGAHAATTRIASLQHARAVSAVSDWLLKRHGLTHRFDFDCEDAIKRLGWLAPCELELLAATIGALMHRVALARRVDGILQRLSPLLGASTVRLVLAGDDPLPARLSECASALRSDTLLADLVAAGAPCLFALWPVEWHAVRQRVVLKFPCGFDLGCERLDETERHALGRWVRSAANALEEQ